MHTSMNADTLLALLPERVRGEIARAPDLDAWLASSIDAARNAWPGLGVTEEDLVRFIADKIGRLAEPALFSRLRTTDLYLALACLGSDARAIAYFEDRFVPEIDRALSRVKLAPAAAQDLRADLREKLLFGREGRAPLLADYSGRGELGGWLRSITFRLALKAKESAQRHVEAGEALDVLVSDETPELRYLRNAHAQAFEAALGRALAELSTRERNLLRQHYLDGLSVDVLGNLYKVHRATAARWIAGARESVLRSVRNELVGRMTPSELESLLQMTKRDLDLRISKILRVRTP